MDKSNTGDRSNHIDLGKGIKFCLNCDEMDDLATNIDDGNKKVVHKRFQNCQKTGRFDGDICSRIYVIGEADYIEEQFTDPIDDI